MRIGAEVSTEALVFVRDLGDGHRVAVEIPGDGSHLTEHQARTAIAFIREVAGTLERSLAAGIAAAKEQGPPS